MADTPPPKVSSIDEVYDSSRLTYQKQRYQNLRDTFYKRYGKEPDFYTRAPGRVNLIGEHIDYSGYSVLPMAVENDIVMAVSQNSEGKLNLSNMNPKFEQRSYDVKNFLIDTSIHEWSNYFLAGFKRVCEDGPISNSTGINVVVDGTVPSGAGLSSSSAMVCCTVLATCFANNVQLSKKRIAEIAILGERYVGVEGGGMDQSISMMAEKGKAKLVDFNPLGVQDVHLPAGAVFVIANSLVTSDKKVTAPRNYNLRVVECRLASVLLNQELRRTLKPTNESTEEVRTLIQVQRIFNQSLQQMLENVEKLLHHEPYTRGELGNLLGLSVQELHDRYMSKFPIEAEGFELYKRALHVYSESLRVYQFKEVCDKPAYPDQLKDLGKLMDASQHSCNHYFNCSCSELEAITHLARCQNF